VKFGRVFSRVGEVFVHNCVNSDEAEPHILLLRLNAAGKFDSTMEAFKGVQIIET
jgi:hypothetical protein